MIHRLPARARGGLDPQARIGAAGRHRLRDGGGALLPGLEARMQHELGVPVTAATDPLRAVARGVGRCVDDFAALQPVLVDGHRF